MLIAQIYDIWSQLHYQQLEVQLIICRGEGADIKHNILTTIYWLLTHYLALKNYGDFEIKQVVISM